MNLQQKCFYRLAKINQRVGQWNANIANYNRFYRRTAPAWKARVRAQIVTALNRRNYYRNRYATVKRNCARDVRLEAQRLALARAKAARELAARRAALKAAKLRKASLAYLRKQRYAIQKWNARHTALNRARRNMRLQRWDWMKRQAIRSHNLLRGLRSRLYNLRTSMARVPARDRPFYRTLIAGAESLRVFYRNQLNKRNVAWRRERNAHYLRLRQAAHRARLLRAKRLAALRLARQRALENSQRNSIVKQLNHYVKNYNNSIIWFRRFNNRVSSSNRWRITNNYNAMRRARAILHKFNAKKRAVRSALNRTSRVNRHLYHEYLRGVDARITVWRAKLRVHTGLYKHWQNVERKR